MKKSLLSLAAVLGLGVMTASAETAIINFGSADGRTKINGTSVTGNDSRETTWTITTQIEETSFTQNSEYSQIGSSKKPATSFTAVASISDNITITKFEAKLGGFSGTAGTISLKIGDQEVATGSLNGTEDVTVTAENLSIEGNGKDLSISVTNIAKGVKFYYISYEYKGTSTELGKSISMVPFEDYGYFRRPTGAPITFSCENAACFLVSMQGAKIDSEDPMGTLGMDMVAATNGVGVYTIPAEYDGVQFGFNYVMAFKSEEDLLAYATEGDEEVEMTATEDFASCTFEVHAASAEIGTEILTDFEEGMTLSVGDEILMMCDNATFFEIVYTTLNDPASMDGGMGFDFPEYINAAEDEPGSATWEVPSYLDGKRIVIKSVNAYGNEYDTYYASEDEDYYGDPNINGLAHVTSLPLDYTVTIGTPEFGELVVEPASGTELVAGEDVIAFQWFNVGAILVQYAYGTTSSDESDDPDASMGVENSSFFLSLDEMGYGEWEVPETWGAGTLTLMGAWAYRNAEDDEPEGGQAFGEDGLIYTIQAAPMTKNATVVFASQEDLQYEADKVISLTADDGTVFSSSATASATSGTTYYPKGSKGYLRMYKSSNNELTINAPTGYNIKSVIVTFKNNDFVKFNFNGNECEVTDCVATWTPDIAVSSVALDGNIASNSNNADITQIAFSLEKTTSGMENVVVAPVVDGAVEYYNLQGVRVANPSNGLYIKRQGNKVSKVIL